MTDFLVSIKLKAKAMNLRLLNGPENTHHKSLKGCYIGFLGGFFEKTTACGLPTVSGGSFLLPDFAQAL
jgi:hypothetical protein